MPRGLALGSLSGIAGTPPALEKRTEIVVEDLCACGARVSAAASLDGVNVPPRRMPFAWAGRKPGWGPLRSSNALRARSATAALGFGLAEVMHQICGNRSP